MDVVGERGVKRAAERLAGQRREARRRARELGRARPELVAYLVVATRGLSDGARGVAWEGFELICEAMAASGLPRVEVERLLAAQEANDELAFSLGVAHPRMADRFLRHGGELRQRALLRRLASRAEAVPAGQRGAVFLAWKTVIDVLDGSPALRS